MDKAYNDLKASLRGSRIGFIESIALAFTDISTMTIETFVSLPKQVEFAIGAGGNIFKEGELDVNSVRKESLLTALDGKKYRTKFYNLDVIISVGYRWVRLRVQG